MTRRRTFLIGLGLAAIASPVLAQSLPIWAAAREPAGREATRDDEAQRAPPARGAPTPAPTAAPAVAQSGPPALSMEAVLNIVRGKIPGSAVGGPTKDGANYVVRWKTTDGHVIDVKVDAVSGAIRN